MKFKPGQQAVCTASGSDWYKALNINQMSFWDRLKTLFRGNKTYGPGRNEIVTVQSIRKDDGFLELFEYSKNGYYDSKHFQPLITDSQLKNELISIGRCGFGS